MARERPDGKSLLPSDSGRSVRCVKAGLKNTTGKVVCDQRRAPLADYFLRSQVIVAIGADWLALPGSTMDT
jgi:hypothetical protein